MITFDSVENDHQFGSRGSLTPREHCFSVYDGQLPDYESPHLGKGSMSDYHLPDLLYGYDALEPYFDARTMELHHTCHHSHYVARLNAALGTTAALRSASEHPINDVLWGIGSIPEESCNPVRISPSIRSERVRGHEPRTRERKTGKQLDR